MQIKLDKFLALTAMLASAQLNSGCVSDNADSDQDTDQINGQGDAGKDAGEEGGDTHSDPSDTTGASADAGDSTTAATTETATTEADGGQIPAADAAVPTDAAISTDAASTPDSAVADAGGEAWPDAATEGSPDAGGEGTPDAGGEAGPSCDLGDATDESFLGNCYTLDSCYESNDAGVAHSYAAELCYEVASNRRASVAEAFWDCFAAQDLADPCTEEGESAAIVCADAADEGICSTPLAECEVIAEGCAEVTVTDCEAALAGYNSTHVALVAGCQAANVTNFGPDYEGCSFDFTNCVLSPTWE